MEFAVALPDEWTAGFALDLALDVAVVLDRAAFAAAEPGTGFAVGAAAASVPVRAVAGFPAAAGAALPVPVAEAAVATGASHSVVAVARAAASALTPRALMPRPVMAVRPTARRSGRGMAASLGFLMIPPWNRPVARSAEAVVGAAGF
ncbi:hypothetical protein [Actinacidiphila sp. bgisy145]|uniref:hypothetical protein n=1 Tax=Actinacidiphila sp. bgisy145 TaxID=3413792 RepID=UPI003EBFF45D